MKTVVGLFDNIEDARDAVDDLVDSGFSQKDISLIARDYEGTYADRLGTHEATTTSAAEGAAAGVVGGGIIGGLAGFLVGMTALVIPGIGPIVAAGPIAAALAGAGIGAATGGVLGALIGWGIPEDEAEYYAEGVRRGGTLVGVKVNESQVEHVVNILDDHGPVNIERRSEYWRETGWEGFNPDADIYTRDDYDREREQYETYGMDGDFDSYTPAFRKHYETNYASTGVPYRRYEPGYRYGYRLANDSRYGTYNSWNEVESVAHSEWLQMNRNSHASTWDEIKEAVRHAWEKATGSHDHRDEHYRETTY